jgi:hypothetical protein
MSFDSSYIRNNKLVELSQMVVNGQITFKLDFIAHISINSHYYFSVFRRYNNPYNIVIEDMAGDVYVHQDTTVRESLQNILCLNDEVVANMHTFEVFSYKHNGAAPTVWCDIADLKWTEIQSQFEAVNVEFRGILQDYHNIVDCIKTEEIPSTPVDYIIPSVAIPSTPVKASISDREAARILIDIPKMADLDEVRECDGPSLSMRFADIQKRKNDCLRACYCFEEDDEEEEDNEDNYIVLRSGTMIPKFQ